MELKPTQKEFILEKFFKNESVPGWRGIAEKLLDKGKCIVAGEDCVWRGGIGNFISTQPVKDAYKCSEYTLNVEAFMNSAWYTEHAFEFQNKAKEEFLKQKEKYEEIMSW